MAFSILQLASFPQHYNQNDYSHDDKRYGIIVDAGSSGTRAHVYQWTPGERLPNVQPVPSANQGFRSSLPLAAAAVNESVIAAIFGPLIKWASKHIPRHCLERCTIYVFGTAGMRANDDVKKAAYDRVVSASYIFLHINSPFIVRAHNIRVISGTEEAVYGWVAANHLLNSLGTGNQMVGVLDMGGASLELALPGHTDDVEEFTLGGHVFRLTAHSFLGYGAKEALAAVTANLTRHATGSFVMHPCFPRNYVGLVNPVRIAGTGRFMECVELARCVLQDIPHFSGASLASRAVLREWIAMGFFVNVNEFFHLQPSSKLADLEEAAIEFCATPWTPAAELADPLSKLFCWLGAYEYALLSPWYKLNPQLVVLKLDELNGVDLSWTVGAMMMLACDGENGCRRVSSRSREAL